MKTYFFAIFVLATVVFSGCQPNDFDDTNVDPRQVNDAPASTLLTFALQQSSFTLFNSPDRTISGLPTDIQLSGYNNNDLNFYSQYLSEGPYPGGSLYSTRNADWGAFYSGPLYNLQTIINYNNDDNPLADISNGSKNNQLAVARIMKAYYFWFLTDKYGDIPYFEALKGNEVLQPVYDSQQTIYTDLFKELKEAASLINEGEAPVTGDILLNGDMAAWKRMANTMRLFLALRLIKNDPSTAQTEFNEALAAGVISSNAENVMYQFIGGDPGNWNPWYKNYVVDKRNDFAISSTIGGYMLEHEDPRVLLYGELLNGEVRPLAYGNQGAVNIPGTYSRLGEAVQGGGALVPLLTYGQVLFARAEAVARGVTTGDAETLYREGIEASWRQWGVYDEAAFNTYLALEDIRFVGGEKAVEQIITQKWLHQFLNGFEAWSDWRRTGYPVLTPAPGAAQGGGIPRRMGYPTNAVSLNRTNYEAAVARQGEDTNFTRIWWDK